MAKEVQYTLRAMALSAVLLLGFSCKSNKISSEGSLDANISAKAVIKTHYQRQLNFNTLSGRLKIEYSDGESSQGVSVSFRMKKDEAIWMSAPLGIVKAYITPERVSFYNKLQNEYFDGDFSYLSELLGTELDFDKLQNLLLGNALFDLREEKYKVSIAQGNYELKLKKPMEPIKVLFQIEPRSFKMASQQLSQPLQKRLLDIKYKNYQKINKWILPKELFIVAIEGDKRNQIVIEYRNIEYNRTLRFPYNIPKGFNEIVLNKDGI